MNPNPTSYGGNSNGQPPQMYPEMPYSPNQPGSQPNSQYNPYGAPPPPGAAPYDPYAVPPTVAANPPSSPYGAPPANPAPYYNPTPAAPPNPGTPYPYPNNAQPPNSYAYPGSVPPPSFPVAPPPAARSSSNKFLLIAAAVMVVLGGLVAVIGISAHNNQVATENSHATATADAGNKATATAQVNATATTVASKYPFSANLKLNDPMTDNTKGMGWMQDSICKFSTDGYHATAIKTDTYYTCPATQSNFSNFTYQVSMKITQGNLAGISFRGNDRQLKYYTFVFRKSDGMYWLLLYNVTGQKPQTLDKNSTAYFNGNSTNDLGVVARGGKITLYINGHELTSTTDSTFTSGQIGTVVYNGEDPNNPVEAVYSNLKVWQL